MNDLSVAKLGASQLNPTTRLPQVQATVPVTGIDNDERPLGNVATFGTLGVTSLPAAASDAGHCEAIIADDVGGLDSVVLATRDERAAGVTAELKGGETCLHSTGSGYDSRVFCKNQSASMTVGDDTFFILDRENETATLHIGGAMFQIGKDGILMSDADGNFISIADGKAVIGAQTVMIGKKQTKVPVAAFSSGAPLATVAFLVDDPNTNTP